ncbi:hypothetical protein [Reyranella sp.]|uniref:hypothetical protein n=1 Tax=Reyranella sp. TaxID=1929291 RepID=UPI003C7EC65E
MSDLAWNYDMTTAPKDNSLLQLLLRHDDGDDCSGGFDDAELTRTMGFNNFVNDGIDEWKFPGWDWCGDCITEQGCGIPIAWAPMLPLPDPPDTP